MYNELAYLTEKVKTGEKTIYGDDIYDYKKTAVFVNVKSVTRNEFFKYGCPPHGGFAVGVDRLTMLLLGLPSVKETEFLFRGPNRLEP